MILLHLLSGGDSPLNCVKKVLLHVNWGVVGGGGEGAQLPKLSNKMIQLNLTTIRKDFSQYIYKYTVLKICSLT